MATKNVYLFRVLFFLAFLVFLQTASAAILLRKDNTDPSTINMMNASATKLFSSRTVIPVTADIIGGELSVILDRPVGTVSVSIVDQNGFVVDSAILDTTTGIELYIPLDGYESGTYQVKISYGTTNLVGTFDLE